MSSFGVYDGPSVSWCFLIALNFLLHVYLKAAYYSVDGV